MTVQEGDGKTEFGKGVNINLTGDDIALAIYSWLVGQGVFIVGGRTIRINEELCSNSQVYVDPSGYVVFNGVVYGEGNPDLHK